MHLRHLVLAGKKFFPTRIFVKFLLNLHNSARNLCQRNPLLKLCKSWWTTQQHSKLTSLSLHGAFPHHVSEAAFQSAIGRAWRKHSTIHPLLLFLLQLALLGTWDGIVLKSNMIFQKVPNQRRGTGLIDDYCQLAICSILSGREMPPLQNCILIAKAEIFPWNQELI